MEARNEYKIQDVHIILAFSINDDERATSAHYGDSSRARAMLAFSVGIEEAIINRKLEEITRLATEQELDNNNIIGGRE